MSNVVTVETVMALGPCHSRAAVEAMFRGQSKASPAEIAAASHVSVDDRAWLLLRMAPREVWMPAVYRAADRAIRHACWALEAAGLGEAAEALACGAPPVVDAASAEAAVAAARAAWDAAAAAGAAAGAAAWAAMDAEAAERQLFLDDLSACVGAS